MQSYHAMCKVVDNLKPNVLIHLAAVSHSNRSNKDPCQLLTTILEHLKIA